MDWAKLALGVTLTALVAAAVATVTGQLVDDPDSVRACEIIRSSALIAAIGGVAWWSGARRWSACGRDDQIMWLEARLGNYLNDLRREIARHRIDDREHDALYGTVMRRVVSIERMQQQIRDDQRIFADLLPKALAAAEWRGYANAIEDQQGGRRIIPFGR